MNLAVHDVRRHAPRFVGTGVGLGLLFTVVLGMSGILAGLIDDAVLLTRLMEADLWVVSQHSRGPFADTSQVDPTLELRVASVPGVVRARAFSFQVLQRDHQGKQIRMALTGLSWPDDQGEALPLVAGRTLHQARGEMIADASLGLAIGEVMDLGQETFRVVGITRQALGSGGDGAVFVSIADASLILHEEPDAAVIAERQRRLGRLRGTDLGRGQPGLEARALDDSWRSPGTSSPPISAVLTTVRSPAELESVRRVIESWGDVRAYSQADEEGLLLQGVVNKARMQIGLFSVILTLTSAVIVAMVIYTMTLEKTHDIAVLGLLGAPRRRIALLVLQQSWLLGAIGYVVARMIGSVAFPLFPRRVVLTEDVLLLAPVLVLVITTVASMLGIFHALRVDPGRVLEG